MQLAIITHMRHEREPSREQLSRGQLFMLSHQDSEMFSGYGITVQAGRMDHLVGVLMVDRPYPATPAWLEQIKALYNECQLVVMAEDGARGLVTQMRIVAESLRFLQPGSAALAEPLQRALQPLLEVPPAPILRLCWDTRRRGWTTEFWITLPPILQDVFRYSGYGCFAVEAGDTVSFVTHTPSADAPGFQTAPIRWRWELITMPSAPLLRFRASILDNPRSPYILEHFLNVADPRQANCLSLLVRQDELSFDIFGDEFEYLYTRRITQPTERRAALEAMVRKAIEYYGSIPAQRRDFDKAKAEFQRRFLP